MKKTYRFWWKMFSKLIGEIGLDITTTPLSIETNVMDTVADNLEQRTERDRKSIDLTKAIGNIRDRERVG